MVASTHDPVPGRVRAVAPRPSAAGGGTGSQGLLPGALFGLPRAGWQREGPRKPPAGGRNLADARWLAKQEEAALVASLLRGRGAMPAFQRQLSEAEARRLLVEVIRPLAMRKKS